jgi:AraC-like DNA-binding protein
MRVHPVQNWTLDVQALGIIVKTPILGGLPMNCLRELAAASSHEFFPERFFLAQAGKSIDRIGIVISGSAELNVQDRHGGTVRFHLLGNGEFFGEMVALDDGCSLYDIVSLTPMKVLLYSKERFLKSLGRHSTLGSMVYQLNAERLKRLYQALAERESSRLPECAQCEQNNVMARAVRFIDENYHEQLTLDQVSHISNLSKFHFVRKFKEIMGLSFKEYLNRKRVEQAKALMKHNGLNISQACYAVGFGDLSYFGRVFRRIEGRSPSDFKKSLKNP